MLGNRSNGGGDDPNGKEAAANSVRLSSASSLFRCSCVLSLASCIASALFLAIGLFVSTYSIPDEIRSAIWHRFIPVVFTLGSFVAVASGATSVAIGIMKRCVSVRVWWFFATIGFLLGAVEILLSIGLWVIAELGR